MLFAIILLKEIVRAICFMESLLKVIPTKLNMKTTMEIQHQERYAFPQPTLQGMVKIILSHIAISGMKKEPSEQIG